MKLQFNWENKIHKDWEIGDGEDQYVLELRQAGFRITALINFFFSDKKRKCNCVLWKCEFGGSRIGWLSNLTDKEYPWSEKSKETQLAKLKAFVEQDIVNILSELIKINQQGIQKQKKLIREHKKLYNEQMKKSKTLKGLI